MNLIIEKTKKLVNILFPYAMIFFIVYLIMGKLIMLAIIPSSSMEDTLSNHSIVFANRIAKNYERYDVSIFKYNKKLLYIKRIIGLPGDEILIANGHVYINGKIAREDFIKEEMIVEEPMSFKVPENCFFMMGDNRNNSFDSRYWDDHFVKKENMVAKAKLSLYPFRLL